MNVGNSLFAGCSVDKLQRVLNCMVRVIFCGDRRDHVTPLLRDKLHWLQARQLITFKLRLLVYKTMNGLAPSYLQDLCVPVTTLFRPAPPSALQLVETLLSLVPGDVSATGHFALLLVP